MARPVSPSLTDHELMIMKVLWEKSPLSVQEVLDQIGKAPKPAYTSLLTAMQNLEKKEYIAHKKEGKRFRYVPLLLQDKYQKSAVRRLLKSAFDGASFSMAVNLLEAKKLSPEEIAKLKEILEEM